VSIYYAYTDTHIHTYVCMYVCMHIPAVVNVLLDSITLNLYFLRLHYSVINMNRPSIASICFC